LLSSIALSSWWVRAICSITKTLIKISIYTKLFILPMI
jgi:hypothetical protein